MPTNRTFSLDSKCVREDCGAGEDAEGSSRCSNRGEVHVACAASSSAVYSGYAIGVLEAGVTGRGLVAVSTLRDTELSAGGIGDGDRGLSSSGSTTIGSCGVAARLAGSAALLAVGPVLDSL